MMKQFAVHLKNGQTRYLRAERYRREREQYVFDRSDSDEVTFFVVSDVTGIEELQQSGQRVWRPPRPNTNSPPFSGRIM